MLRGRRSSQAATLPPSSAVLPSMPVGELPQVSQLGSGRKVSAGPDLQSHWAPPRAADAVRMGVRRQTYRAPNARALYRMPEPTRGLGMGRPGQARTPTGAANAVRLALRSPAHGQPNADPFHRMPETAEWLKLANGLRCLSSRRTNLS